MKVLHRFLCPMLAGGIGIVVLLLAGCCSVQSSSTPPGAHLQMPFYNVNGEVRMPGQYPYRGEITVTRAIAAAGGFTDLARQRKVKLTRVGGKTYVVDFMEILKNPATDLPVYPGDHILVQRKEVFYW